jgi:alkylation response protein AidB-like acyl-CoA dehydrogenase
MNVSDQIDADLGRAAEELLERTMSNAAVRASIDECCFSAQAWACVSRAGWFDALVPAELGGLDLGVGALRGILTAVGRHLLPGPVAEHAAVVPELMRLADAPALERLHAATAGDRMVALVDQGSVESTPYQPFLRDGRIEGEAELVRFGDLADDLIVLIGGGTDTGASPAAVALVPAKGAGVRITRRESFDPATRFAVVEFESVRPEHLIAHGRGAALCVARIRSCMRLLVAAEICGISRSLLDSSVAYAAQREQFDRPIGSFQALQHILADMAAGVLVLEAAVGDFFARAGEESDLEHLSWQLKALAARTGRLVAESALQVHGGIAFTAEHDLHRGVQHLLALQGSYGDERQLAWSIGAALLRGDLDPWT